MNLLWNPNNQDQRPRGSGGDQGFEAFSVVSVARSTLGHLHRETCRAPAPVQAPVTGSLGCHPGTGGCGQACVGKRNGETIGDDRAAHDGDDVDLRGTEQRPVRGIGSMARDEHVGEFVSEGRRVLLMDREADLGVGCAR